jgi:hypothetical protein
MKTGHVCQLAQRFSEDPEVKRERSIPGKPLRKHGPNLAACSFERR